MASCGSPPRAPIKSGASIPKPAISRWCRCRRGTPRRIAITSDDVLWYGDYSRGYLGSYDPKTGKAREWKSPAGIDSAPYGITAVGDVVWYSESGASPNTLVRFDPKTEK